MKNVLLLLLFVANLGITKASILQSPKDSIRTAQLDAFWKELSRTVREGDFEGYKKAYHPDAVIVFASGKKKTTMSIADALERWRQGFMDTKAGKTQDQVEFRFSQRIGNETTAHETGIFVFSSADANGKVTAKFTIHFDMLFVKKEGKWLAVMEHQRSNASDEEWEALK